MNVFEAVKTRRSIRKFLGKDIPGNILNKLIESLIWAPSAGNLQSRKFFFVQDSSVKKALSRAAHNQDFISSAPLVVVGCTDSRIAERYGERGIRLYSIQDVTCSIMGLMLIAHEFGLGTVWVGAFDEEEVTRVLNLPENLRPVVIVPVGRPEKIPPAPKRINPEEAVIWV